MPALVLALTLATVSCGDAGTSETTATTVRADGERTPPSTSGVTAGTRPDAVDEGGEERRPQVVLGGDSVMGNLVPAVDAAIGDQADIEYLAQARISGDAAARQAWSDTIAEEDPDLVVIHVGSWEVLSPEFRPLSADGFAEYATEQLDPFVELLTSGGARVLFVGPAAARDEQRTVNLMTFNRELIALDERNPSVDFLNAGTYVNGPTGGFTEVLPGPNGVPVRIRRTDDLGLHLCPAGVVRLATPVLGWIGEHTDPPVAPVAGWDQGDWSRPPLLDKPEQCPAVS